MDAPDLSAVLYGSPAVRRAVTVPTVAATAGALASTAWIWGPAALGLDALTAPRRLPRLRSLSMATAWSALETVGVGLSVAQWAAGLSKAPGPSYALQRWWVRRLVDALRLLGNLQIEVEGDEVLAPGPTVMLARHASIADSLLPAWLLARRGMHPRYVLKRELLVDPCLDIVGGRVPNHFVVRNGDDTDAELAALRALSTGMSDGDAAVIFPEGTVASDERRARALASIAARDIERADRVRDLAVLLPPRHAGARALLEGSPTSDVLLVTHRGFEQLGRLADVPARLPLDRPVQVNITRVARAEVPTGDAFVPWLDACWLQLDAWVTEPATRPGEPS